MTKVTITGHNYNSKYGNSLCSIHGDSFITNFPTRKTVLWTISDFNFDKDRKKSCDLRDKRKENDNETHLF